MRAELVEWAKGWNSERSERYRWWVLFTALAGLFSINITFTILAVALPKIAKELHSTTNTLTWASQDRPSPSGLRLPCWAKRATCGAIGVSIYWGCWRPVLRHPLRHWHPTPPRSSTIRTLEGLEVPRPVRRRWR